MRFPRPFIALLTCTSLLLLAPGPGSVQAGGAWRVVPIRLDFDQRSRSGSITLHNEGDAPVTLQMRAMQWRQDARGQDEYDETADLVYFPKVMTVPPGESRVLRSGINVPATTVEKSYRLFIEELPAPQKSEGAAVSIAVRFGVPVFAAPVKPEMRGEIVRLDLGKESATATVRNTGNVHFRIHAVHLVGRDESGNELFRGKKDGWYLLSGTERLYTLPFPQEGCGNAATMEILVNTDKGDFSAREKVAPDLCGP